MSACVIICFFSSCAMQQGNFAIFVFFFFGAFAFTNSLFEVWKLRVTYCGNLKRRCNLQHLFVVLSMMFILHRGRTFRR